MLTDTDLRELHEQAGQLSDSRIEQALRFAAAQKRFPDYYPDAASESERVDAWILVLRMEQARRAGKLCTLSDQDVARLWLQLSDYRDSLREAGLTVEMQIKEIDNHQVHVAMVISGPPAVVGQTINQSVTG